MEEEEIYINLFDRYNRNEIDHSDMVDSLEEMDIDSNINDELHSYQTAIAILEQGYLREMINEIEKQSKVVGKSKGSRLWNIPAVL